MFLDEFFDMWSDRRSIEAHHEQLALCRTSLATPLAACSQDRPTIALHHGNVSRTAGRIAQRVGKSGCDAYLSRLSQTGSNFSAFAMMTMQLPDARHERTMGLGLDVTATARL
jgi:hypothetical protein